MGADKRYLQRRHSTWMVVVEIPERLRAAAGGKRRYKRSLRTDSLSEANRLKHAHVAEFNRRIAALAKEAPDRDVGTVREALEHRRWLEQASTYLSEEEEERGFFSDHENVLDTIRERARELEEDDPEQARRFFKAATGQATPLRDVSTQWLAERSGQVRESVRSQQRAVINAFLRWAGEHTTVEQVNRRRAGDYVSHLLSPASGIARSTTRRYASTLSELWEWLISLGRAESNPWRRHKLGKPPPKARRALSDEALLAVLTGTPDKRSKYGAVLHDLARLALMTGARLDELCSLRCTDIETREDGLWLNIRHGKTAAAVRSIPIHASVAHVVERRLKDGDEFLFAGLTPGGPDARRSWNISRAFSAYRKRVGVKGGGEVFHSLRNTFIEFMEGAEVPGSTVKLLVGHHRKDQTFGGYSTGQRVNLRGAIEKLEFSPEIMSAIATTPRSEE